MPEDKRFESSAQAKEYHRISNFLFLVNLVISLIGLLVIIVFGLTIFLRAYIMMFFENKFVVNGIFFIIFYLTLGVFGFPLDLFEGFTLEHRFKLSRQNFLSWLKDYFKKTVITLIIALIIVEGVYLFIGSFYKSWWIFAAFLWLLVTVIFTKIFPLIILPLFFKSSPVKDDSLRNRINKLAGKFNFKLKDILVLELSKKTVKANAMVTGIGKTKRIYLSDTLLNDFSHDEIEIIIAHELTHDKNKDIYSHIAVSFLVSLLSFYVCDLFLTRSITFFGYTAKDDIANLPLLTLLVLIVGIFVLPFQNSFSRRMEKEADTGAIKATNNPQGFISMISKLGHKNLAEFSPSRIVEIFLYDHPPISQRINLAKQFIKG
ncbi:MAG: M48 family metallopeptidase [Candidatus Omnitrophica bacterium]|nr:M48 family metallopeptidase [Candidatus Omnitrophota bacterium]